MEEPVRVQILRGVETERARDRPSTPRDRQGGDAVEPSGTRDPVRGLGGVRGRGEGEEAGIGSRRTDDAGGEARGGTRRRVRTRRAARGRRRRAPPAVRRHGRARGGDEAADGHRHAGRGGGQDGGGAWREPPLIPSPAAPPIGKRSADRRDVGRRRPEASHHARAGCCITRSGCCITRAGCWITRAARGQ